MGNDPRDNDQLGGDDEATYLHQEEPDTGDDGDAGEALKLPGYQVIRELGSGGMGQVFLARQLEPVDREVAIKLIRRKILSPASEVRFLVERQALAQMRHPAIAQIHEAGTNPDGYPYFAMEYVPGLPLDEFCDENRLDLTQRLELFIRICQGVAHAHQKGIIHRDLKPANILVSLIDGVPSPKIIDFGIAGTAVSSQERHDQGSAGTPMYMSPELFDRKASIDVRSDVYSLGVILYELLTDLQPFHRSLFRGKDTERIRERLAGMSPETPTGLLSASHDRADAIAEKRRTTVRALERRIKGELSTIAHKAVHPDRDQRYDSTVELADDVRNHLSHHPVRAMGDSRGYRLRCFVRRNAVAVSSVSMVGVALAVGMTAALLGMAEAQRQQQIAEERQLELEKMIAFQQSMLGDLEPRLLGEGFVERLRQQYAQSFDHLADEETVRAGVDAFELAVGQINPTDLAQDLIDEFMLKRAIDSIEADFADEPLLQADLYETVRDVYSDAGMIDLALPLARRIVELRKTELGPADTRTLVAQHLHFRLLSRNRDFDQAAIELEAVLEHMDAQAPDQLSLRHNAWDSQANLLVNTGHNEEALDVALHNLDLVEAEVGVHHEYTVRAVNTIGYVHALSGDLETALDYFRDSAERARGRFDKSEPAYYSARFNVAAALSGLGRFEEAHEIENEIYDILATTYGRRHISALRIMNNRAHTMMNLGRIDEAISQMKEAVSLSEQTHGLNHLLTLSKRQTLADLYLQTEDYTAALDKISEVALWFERLQGVDHLDTAQAWHHQARAHLGLGEWSAAQALAEKAHELRVEQIGAGHRATLGTARLLADIHRAAGQPTAELTWRERIHEQVADGDRGSSLDDIMNAIRLLELKNADEATLGAWISARLDNDDSSLEEARAAFAALATGHREP
jgi:eukaryotic-like serine/threonine-protein kinase